MGKTIHELDAAAALAATDEIEVYQGADPSKVAALSAVKTALQTGGGIALDGIVGPLAQLDVDNLRLDGNTLSSTTGDINLTPNSTSSVRLASGGAAAWQVNGVTAALESAVYGSSFALLHRDGTATNPCAALRSDVTTGIGTAGSGTVSLIALGVEAARVTAQGLQALRPVEASTAGSGAPNVLAAPESRKLLTNEGAGAEAYHTLPAAAAGLGYSFYCQTASGIRIVAAAGDTIRLGPSVSAAAGFVRSEVVGSALTLVAINATEWVALAIVDTWTIDS
jgi:hypothetical protein